MPRPSNKSKLPKSITPADWKDQVANTIKGEFHPGRGPDDLGGIVPLALIMLRRAKIDDVVGRLIVANNNHQFDRFDTDKGNGVDLVDIIIKCVIFGKQLRRPGYDLRKIEDAYDTATPEIQDVMFRETMVIAKELLIRKRAGQPSKVQRNHLMVWLNERLRKRFGNKNYSEVISLLLRITPSPSAPTYSYIGQGDPITAGSVETKLKELAKKPEDERIKLAIERRLLKVWRVTGSPDGRVNRGVLSPQ